MNDSSAGSNSGEGSSVQTIKFDSGNFGMWKMRIIALLISKGLLDAVLQHGNGCKCVQNERDGNEINNSDAENNNDSETAAAAKVNTSDTNTKKKKSHTVHQGIKKAKDNTVQSVSEGKGKKAYGLLVLCLGVEQLRMIQQIAVGDAHGVWCILIDNYERKSMESQVVLYEQLFNLKIKEKEKITVFVARLIEIEIKLKQQYKENISDRMLMFILLRGLPHSFMSLVQLLKMNDDVTFEQAVEQLRNEEERQLSHPKIKEIALNYAASNQERTVKCWTCEKEGHSKFNCPQNINKTKCSICRKIGHNEEACWNKDKGRRIATSNKRTNTSANSIAVKRNFNPDTSDEEE